jgi:hypothetical protein
VNWKVESYFQKIYPYSQDKNSPLNSGWYHIDSHENIAAGIIYLNPHSNLDAGTTIGSIKPNFEINQNDFEWRNKLYSDSVLDLNQYQHKIIDHNLKFEKTLEFKNVYNRMVMYDADYWHKESNFYINDCEPRLTQVFFINKIESESGTPMQRMNGAYI